MEIVLYALLFIISAYAFHLAGKWVVLGILQTSKLLGVREFVLAFFVMALASSLPNLFVGVTSALQGIPELSLGDVFGNNFVAMTLAVAAAVIFAKGKTISTEGASLQSSLIFTAIAAILPIILLVDGSLGRWDGLVLLLFFLMYIRWLLASEGRFSKKYAGEKLLKDERDQAGLGVSVLNVLKVLGGCTLFIAGAFGIVTAASFFAGVFSIPIVLVGLLIVGFGGALPEIYFSIESTRHGNPDLVMGNIMGAVIVPATFVLGVVALIRPIRIDELEAAAVSRMFLLLATLLFFIFAITKREIGRQEAMFLIFLYIAFVMSMIWFA
jgi:cation:H+ antiporter